MVKMTRCTVNVILFFVIFFQMLSSKDLNFVGYTYKNFELVNDHDVPGMGTALSFWLLFHTSRKFR